MPPRSEGHSRFAEQPSTADPLRPRGRSIGRGDPARRAGKPLRVRRPHLIVFGTTRRGTFMEGGMVRLHYMNEGFERLGLMGPASDLGPIDPQFQFPDGSLVETIVATADAAGR